MSVVSQLQAFGLVRRSMRRWASRLLDAWRLRSLLSLGQRLHALLVGIHGTTDDADSIRTIPSRSMPRTHDLTPRTEARATRLGQRTN